MNPDPLLPSQLLEKIPGLHAVEPCFDRGGFKWVYQATVQGRNEALKVLAMRAVTDPTVDPDLAEAYLREQYARIRREVQALATCNVPEIVKLGAISPVEFETGGAHYLAYSEEFVEGADLWKLIGGRGIFRRCLSWLRFSFRCFGVFRNSGDTDTSTATSSRTT